MKSRIEQLDVLRGIAVLLVLGHHSVIPAAKSGIFEPAARFLEIYGWTGVDLFFVLSGFLIGGLLIKETSQTGTLDIRRFLIRRAFKIWPSYFFFLGCCIVLLWFKGGLPSVDAKTQETLRYWPNLLHIQNYVTAVFPGWDPPVNLLTPQRHTWTLAVEEHFYLLLPFLILLTCFGVRGGTRLPLAASCLCLGAGVLRLFHLSDSQGVETFDQVYHETQFRFDSLLFGCLLAYANFTHAKYFQSLTNLQRLSVLTVAVGLISWPLWLSHHRWESLVFGFPALYLGWGAITILFVSMPDSRFLRLVTATTPARCVRWVGVMSYTFYLWHNHGEVRGRINYHTTSGFMKDWNESIRWIAANILYFALAGFAAYLTSKLIEQPALRFRDHRFPARAKIGETTVRT